MKKQTKVFSAGIFLILLLPVSLNAKFSGESIDLEQSQTIESDNNSVNQTTPPPVIENKPTTEEESLDKEQPIEEPLPETLVEVNQDEVIKVGYVLPATGKLNVREAAGTNYNIIGSLQDGEKIEIFSEQEGWYKVKYNDGIGYVFAEYITDKEPAKVTEVAPETAPQTGTSGWYENIVTVSNFDSITVLVNKNNALSSSYEPSDLSVVNVSSVNGTVYLREEAARQIESLVQTAQNESGLTILARSGYRSYQTQSDLYKRYVNANGQAKADTFSARPGHSEHQTGLAIDVTADSVGGQLSDNFGNTAEGQWINNNAHRFGYIVRYKLGTEDKTGYQYEPWHLRYVGVDVATTIYNNGLILEEY